MATRTEAERGDVTKLPPSWSPYDQNGGTCMAVAGDDYCIVSTSTRMSSGLSVLSRDSPCLTRLGPACIVVSSGFQADIKKVHKDLQEQAVLYQHRHGKSMSCPAAAQLVSNTLYSRRFFPYYTSTVCAGLDGRGAGCVYEYDVVGSMTRVDFSCQGSGESLIQPVLDSQLKVLNLLVKPPKEELTHLSLEEALDLVKDAFVSAGERDIYTGDRVDIHVVERSGIRLETLELKKD